MTKMIEYNNGRLGKVGTGYIHGVMVNFMRQLD